MRLIVAGEKALRWIVRDMMLIRRRRVRVEIEHQTLRIDRQFLEPRGVNAQDGSVPEFSLDTVEAAALAGWIKAVQDGEEEKR